MFYSGGLVHCLFESSETSLAGFYDTRTSLSFETLALVLRFLLLVLAFKVVLGELAFWRYFGKMLLVTF